MNATNWNVCQRRLQFSCSPIRSVCHIVYPSKWNTSYASQSYLIYGTTFVPRVFASVGPMECLTFVDLFFFHFISVSVSVSAFDPSWFYCFNCAGQILWHHKNWKRIKSLSPDNGIVFRIGFCCDCWLKRVKKKENEKHMKAKMKWPKKRTNVRTVELWRNPNNNRYFYSFIRV